MAEDRPREAYDRQDRTEEHSFDELARGLASGSVSRKQALKLVGAALLGGVLASIPGVALAQRGGGGSSACEAFCHATFIDRRQAGECISAGAQGVGPCFECSPDVGTGPNFTPPECGEGAIFNSRTCECEPTGPTTCTQACCCHCLFEDPATGERTAVCNANSPATTPLECAELCGADVPSGETLLSSGFSCTGDGSPDNAYVCAPASAPPEDPPTTGLVCSRITCVP